MCPSENVHSVAYGKKVILIIVKNNFGKFETFNESAIKGTGSFAACYATMDWTPTQVGLIFKLQKYLIEAEV